MNSIVGKNRKAWLGPFGLVLLSAVPVIAGAFRIAELTGGGAVTPDNARFFASPIPVMLHIIGATLYATLGAFQFVPTLRSRKHRWHRVVGRVLVVCGLTAALFGLWMNQFYPRPVGDGELLYWIRIVFGTMMVLSIVFGFTAILRRDFTAHSAWMTRAYATGMGAGTQVLTHIPWMLLFGAPDEFTRAMLMGAGWVINLAVAEWVIYKRHAQRTHVAPAMV